MLLATGFLFSLRDSHAQEAHEDAAKTQRELFIAKQYSQTQKALVRRVCQLSDEQASRLDAVDEQWHIAAALTAKVADLQPLMNFQMENQRIVVRDHGEPIEVKKVRSLFADIDRVIDQVLSPEQQAEFHRERDLAVKSRREAVADAIVLVYDRQLYLDADQKRRLSQAIVTWFERQGEELYWSFYVNNREILPAIPGQVLMPALNRDQIDVLSTMGKMNYRSANAKVTDAINRQGYMISR